MYDMKKPRFSRSNSTASVLQTAINRARSAEKAKS